MYSVKLGVCPTVCGPCCYSIDCLVSSGSKDRLDRAKTIDLCQNPLTVSTRFVCSTITNVYFRKSLNSLELDKYLNGRNTMLKLLDLPANLQKKERSTPALPQRMSMCSPMWDRQTRLLKQSLQRELKLLLRNLQLPNSLENRLETSCKLLFISFNILEEILSLSLLVAPLKDLLAKHILHPISYLDSKILKNGAKSTTTVDDF